MYGYEQHTLHKCVTVSTMKNKEQSHKSGLLRHLLGLGGLGSSHLQACLEL